MKESEGVRNDAKASERTRRPSNGCEDLGGNDGASEQTSVYTTATCARKFPRSRPLVMALTEYNNVISFPAL